MTARANRLLLFLYPICFALPDVYVPAVVTRLRLDDLVAYGLFVLNVRSIFDARRYYRPSLFYLSQALLAAWAGASLVFVLLLGRHAPSWYQVVQTIGSLPIILVFPVLLSDEAHRRSLARGAVWGALIFFIGLWRNYFTQTIGIETPLHKASDFHKMRFAFRSLNANAVGLFGILLGYMALADWYRTGKRALLLGAALGFSVPFFILARGHALCLLTALAAYAALKKRAPGLKLAVLAAVAAFLAAVAAARFAGPVLRDALNLDLATGEGLTYRHVLWRQGWELIVRSKGLGYGFSTIAGLYRDEYDGLTAHNVYLQYVIELGFPALILFLFSVGCLVVDRLRLHRSTGEGLPLLQASMVLGFLAANMFEQSLYFNKHAFLLYALSTMAPIRLR